MEIAVGNIIRLKKKHPCGSMEWEVLRTGADFRLFRIKHLQCSLPVALQAFPGFFHGDAL